MSILTNWYRNKPWVRPFVLGAVVAALGAGGVAYLGPIAVTAVHYALCGDNQECLKFQPPPLEIPKKP